MILQFFWREEDVWLCIVTAIIPYRNASSNERKNPAKIDTSRRRRIARGSGTTIEEVNRLMKQFEETRKMMKMMSGNKFNSMRNIRRR